MIGIAEIIFSIIAFCVSWFLIFKFRLLWLEKNKYKNIVEKMEKQEKKFIIDGKNVDIKEQLGLTNNSLGEQTKPNEDGQAVTDSSSESFRDKKVPLDNKEDKVKKIKEGFKK